MAQLEINLGSSFNNHEVDMLPLLFRLLVMALVWAAGGVFGWYVMNFITNF
jgi:hypothetical protein